MSYAKLNLTGNPFRNNIPKPDLRKTDHLVWAGQEKIKSKIGLFYERALNNNYKQIVLNWGPYGGGKTFSADYFINYQKFDLTKINLTQIYIRSPKSGNIAGKELFKNIMDYLSFSEICKRASIIFKDLGEEVLYERLNNRIKSEEFSRSILLLGSDDTDILETMRRYVYSGLSRAELKTLRLARNIETITDNIKFVSGILALYSFPINKKESRIILWLDEMEDLIYYAQKEYRSFSQMLRDLFDTLNENFTVFMNFTFSEPQEDTIELLLGGAIWSRINSKIRFKELNDNDAFEYINQLLKFYQIDKTKECFPFNEDLIKKLLSLIPKSELTPRSINRVFGEILEFTIENNLNDLSEAYPMWYSSKNI
jgi:Cdc6-like AAA superfamily ATPase